jgi:hypothetical protein
MHVVSSSGASPNLEEVEEREKKKKKNRKRKQEFGRRQEKGEKPGSRRTKR